ncbi:MAG: 2-amino-4-hydroxy-6-hydroxymethyldihydropteridine diphosphokinase [Pseudomonadota bacterium]
MDKIFLTDLTVEAVIGIYEWERKIKQTLHIDLEMAADIRRAAASDSIEATVNYKAIAKRLLAYTADSEFQLVETLAETLAGIVTEEFGVPWVRLRVNKKGAVRHARDVGVVIERGSLDDSAAVTVYVSAGSNVDPAANLATSLELMRERFGPLAVSTVYRNAAEGFEGDDFLNLVAGFETTASAREVAAALREIESACGRARDVPKFSDRTLDLDMLLYGDHVIRNDAVSVPREEMLERVFMLQPLAELAGFRRHPETGVALATLWERFDGPPHAMQPVSLDRH